MNAPSGKTDESDEGSRMTRVVTNIRCVPRCGFEYTEVRTVDLEAPSNIDDHQMHRLLNHWFVQRGIEEAVYAIETDDTGYFAIINDEAFKQSWGTSLEL